MSIESPQGPRSGPHRILGLVAVVVTAAVIAGSFAIATDALGTGEGFARLLGATDGSVGQASSSPSAPGTGSVTPRPSEGHPTPSITSPASTERPRPTSPATPAPTVPRSPVDVSIVTHPASVFAHQRLKTWCAPAGLQMTLAVLGLANTSNAFQAALNRRVGEWTSYADSHDGGWGPMAMTKALAAYGARGYEVRTYPSRLAALRDAAVALETTRSPVLLLAWYGAHTWVMTGFRADADPALFTDATVSGTYILDPWYPWVSTIWGPSDPPATFQDTAEMIRNYRAWKRPEGHYPKRDGLFVAVVPTLKAPGG